MNDKKLSDQFAGRAAIASGVVGIMAFGVLIYALVAHLDIAPGEENIRFRVHDAGVILQFIFMIPVVFGLTEFSSRFFKGESKNVFFLGVGSLSFTVLLLLLNFCNVIADVLYMVPQGIFGVWLMIVNKRLTGILSKGLRRLGIVAGLGLLIVGTFPISMIVFVDTVLLHGPVPSTYIDQDTTANNIIHLILPFGTLMGVTTYPVWSLLLGRRILREGRFKVHIH